MKERLAVVLVLTTLGVSLAYLALNSFAPDATLQAGGPPIVTTTSTPTPTVMPTPIPVTFALGIDVDTDGDNDCGTGVPAASGDGAPDAVPVQLSDATCTAAADSEIVANVYLVDNSGVAYGGIVAHLEFTGLTSSERGTSPWSGCVFPVSTYSPTVENAGCAIGINAPPQTNVGLVVRFTFTCAASGTVGLRHGSSYTALTDNDLVPHSDPGEDALDVTCGGAQATPTPTQVGGSTPDPTNDPGATSTSTATVTLAPGVTPTSTAPPGLTTPTIIAPTDTPALTSTATLTRTPTRTPTRTRTPTPSEDTGDANCSGTTDSIDAALILQLDAGIIDDVLCEDGADVDGRGGVNSIDAALVLQYVAGIIDDLS